MKTTFSFALFIAISLFASFGAAEDIQKDNEHHKITYKAAKDGVYVIRGTASVKDGYENPSVELRITINNTQCAQEKMEYHNNNATVNAVGMVKLKEGVVYTIEARQKNHHATASGVTVTISPEEPVEVL